VEVKKKKSKFQILLLLRRFGKSAQAAPLSFPEHEHLQLKYSDQIKS